MAAPSTPPAIRPPLPNRITVFLDDELAARLSEIAQLKGMERGQAARYLIARGADWWDTISAAAQVAG